MPNILHWSQLLRTINKKWLVANKVFFLLAVQYGVWTIAQVRVFKIQNKWLECLYLVWSTCLERSIGYVPWGSIFCLSFHYLYLYRLIHTALLSQKWWCIKYKKMFNNFVSQRHSFFLRNPLCFMVWWYWVSCT